MIATIGWIVDAPASMMNVCGDIPSTMIVEKLVNKKPKSSKNEKENAEQNKIEEKSAE